MVYHFNGREQRRSSARDPELDALVAHEVDALSSRVPRPPSKHPASPLPTASGRSGVRAEGSAPGRGQVAHSQPRPGAKPERILDDVEELEGIETALTESEEGVLPFSAEEERFIEQSVAFLRGRANADVLIEQVWSRAVLEGDDSEEAALDDRENAQAEISEPPPEGDVRSVSFPANDGPVPGIEAFDRTSSPHPMQNDDATNATPAKAGAAKTGQRRGSPPGGNRSK
jgi:hypothetical protein